MTYYRLLHLDLSMRFELALQMLNLSRPWGLVTALSEIYDVSRKFLYELRDKAEASILTALAGQPPGPKPVLETLIINGERIQRGIVTLATSIPGSIRGIQTCLEELLDTHCSIGFISQTLQLAGKVAEEHNQLLVPKGSVLGEADEIFQGRHPCLTVVDGNSFAVLQLSPQISRDALTWGVSFLEMQDRGVRFHDLACDGARGIRAGVQQAGLTIPLRPDLFHLLREANHLMRQLESSAYKVIEEAERCRRAESEAHGERRRKGRRLKVQKSVPEAQTKEQEAVDRYDLFVWLCQEIRQCLEPWTSEYMLTSSQQARETLETAIELMKDLGSVKINEYAQDLKKHEEELLAPLVWLEQQLSPWRDMEQAGSFSLESDMESTIIWAYKYRQALDLDDSFEGFPVQLRPVVKAFWQALSLFHRSSSLAESLHSWLRPYFQMHRGIPAWLAPLLQFYWNHHTFQRGKRKGKSPLGENTTWSQVLDLLIKPGVESKVA